MDPKILGPQPGPGQVGGAPPPLQGTPVHIPPISGPAFRDVLRQTQTTSSPPKGEPLKFSAHALARLQSRNITLSPQDVEKLNVMTDKAAAKGAKQSLFMMRDIAMVVSVKNRVVITAVDHESMKDNVFTNIDSAAII